MRGPREPAVFVVNAVAVEPSVNAGEDLMGFVDQTEIERRRPAQAFEPRVAAAVFAPGKENAPAAMLTEASAASAASMPNSV